MLVGFTRNSSGHSSRDGAPNVSATLTRRRHRDARRVRKSPGCSVGGEMKLLKIGVELDAAIARMYLEHKEDITQWCWRVRRRVSSSPISNTIENVCGTGPIGMSWYRFLAVTNQYNYRIRELTLMQADVFCPIRSSPTARQAASPFLLFT